jgi:hypothetical protein
MTEAEWNACTQPRQMLQALRRKASDRKLRLFACASCRRSFRLMTDERSRQAVEVAERFADELAGPLELAAAWFDADAAVRNAKGPRGAAWYAHAATRHTAWGGAGTAKARRAAWEAAQSSQQQAQAAILRDIFGNPFRPVCLDPAWLAWNDGTMRRLAAAIYGQGRFRDLPVLADALEDAGCDNEEVLTHCRGSGPHAKGC